VRLFGGQGEYSGHSVGQPNELAAPHRLLSTSTTSEQFRGHGSSCHTGPNFCERCIAGSGSVVAEWREAAIVGCAQLRYRNVFGCLKHALANFFGRLNSWINRCNDSDEYAMVGLHVSTNGLQDL